MRYWRLVFLIILFAIIQVSLLSYLPFREALPNLIMTTIIALLLAEAETAALWWIALGGLLLDIYSPFPFGIYTGQFLIIFLIFRLLLKPLLHEPSALLAALIFFILSLFFNGVQMAILHLPLFFTWPLVSLYEALIGSVIYYIILHRQSRNALVKIR